MSSDSLFFSRPRDVASRRFYYQAIQATVSIAGNYTFLSKSSVDTVGYLYIRSFNPYNAALNLMVKDDDGGNELQFRIEAQLILGESYILVVTTYWEFVTGDFSISSVGPAYVSLTSITPLTTPSTTTSRFFIHTPRSQKNICGD